MDLYLLMERIGSDFNSLQKHLRFQEISNRTNEDTVRQLQEEIWFCQNSHYAKTVLKENRQLKSEVEALTARLNVSQDIIRSMKEVVDAIRLDVKLHFVNDYVIELNNQGMSAFRIAQLFGVTKAMVNEVLKKAEQSRKNPVEGNEDRRGQKNHEQEKQPDTAIEGANQ